MVVTPWMAYALAEKSDFSPTMCEWNLSTRASEVLKLMKFEECRMKAWVPLTRRERLHCWFFLLALSLYLALLDRSEPADYQRLTSTLEVNYGSLSVLPLISPVQTPHSTPTPHSPHLDPPILHQIGLSLFSALAHSRFGLNWAHFLAHSFLTNLYFK